jgi:thiol:disulfide interchange protein
MKKFILIIVLAGLAITANAQQTTAIKLTDTAKLYNPAADAKADIQNAVKQAAAAHKNVFLQIGGNWCIWCIRFNDLVTKDTTLNKYLRANFIVVHVNYSKENMNEQLLAGLGYPQRFGFPVFIILDDKGMRLHTQNSEYLEEGKGHSKEKVLGFLKDWSPAAIDPKNYEKTK